MKEITLEAVVDNIPQITALIDEELEKNNCPRKAQMQIELAADEIFCNIAYYAYDPGPGKATVRIDFDGQDRMVSVTFIDSGVPFNPLEKASPDVTLPAREREIGGLGIFLVRKTMDDIEYRYEEDKNILTIKKHI